MPAMTLDGNFPMRGLPSNISYCPVRLLASQLDYVNRYATKEAADAATDESSSEDDSSIASFSDDDDAPGLEL